MRWALGLALGVAVVAAVAAVASASPPVVEIRAQAALSLGKVRLLPDGRAQITGTLSDKLTGAPLGEQRVVILIGDQRAEGGTSPEGTFSIDIAVDPGPQTITLKYGGYGEMDAAAPLVVTTDPSRAQVALTIAKADDDAKGAHLVVRATADDQSVRLPVDISVGAPGGDDAKLVHLVRVDSGAPFLLSRTKAGGPGPHRVHATFAGDDARQPAVADTTLDLTSTSTTSIDGASGDVPFEDDITVVAKVTDEDGAIIPRAAVTFTASSNNETRRLAQGITAEDGTFTFKVEGAIMTTGKWGLQVLAEPSSTYIKASRSNVLNIHVASPQPVPVSWTIVGFIATFAAAGGFFLARAKPWERFRRAQLASNAPAKASEDAPLIGGLVTNKPSIVSTLRRAADDGFAGVVRDTVRGRPVADATVRLVLGGADHQTVTAADGSFAFEGLGHGEHRAEVAAPGHVTEKFVVSIPHRGELRDVRVDLVPVREKVFQLYRRAAEPILPEPKLWGIWSPRQIVDHVRTKRPSPALAELTDFVEELYFSSRLAAETVIPHASERVDKAVRERART